MNKILVKGILVAIGIFMVLDGLETSYAVRMLGTSIEINSFMRWLMESLGSADMEIIFTRIMGIGFLYIGYRIFLTVDKKWAHDAIIIIFFIILWIESFVVFGNALALRMGSVI